MRDSDHDEYAVIRSQTSDLVLDASDYEVKVERFTGLPAQRWKLENAYLGTFFFVNQSNGWVRLKLYAVVSVIFAYAEKS